VPGSPFPSGGRNPVGVGLRGDRLIVVNKDADLRQPSSGRPSYVALRIRSDGALEPLGNGTVLLAENASPTQPLTTNAGRFVFGCQFRGAGPIDVLTLGSNGLARVGGVPVPVHGRVTTDRNRMPLGMWAHPRSRILYVGLPNVSRLAVFSWDANGGLTFLRSVASAGSAICWLVGNRAGSRLYGSDTGSRQISVYDTGNAANPVEIQTVTLKGTGLPFQLTLSPDGGWLYVLSQRVATSRPTSANALHVLRVGSNGRLAEVAGSPTVLPIATGDRPQGVAAL
jgi:DNA-binding beta-propeller fold protein YncE